MSEAKKRIDESELSQLLPDDKLVEWFDVKLTSKQLRDFKMICDFHLQNSDNEKAKEANRKLQWCLKHWCRRASEG